MAFGDLDNDGDLDVVINRLNQNVGLFRNNTKSRRISIRLEGKAPNTNAIGAKIEVIGNKSIQSREIVSGGRYLSGSDHLQVFAANDEEVMSATITWRNGSQTKIDSLFANREYTIREKNTFYPNKEDNPIKQLYENVRDLIDHKHIEKPFDDFSKQSLLPNGFSQIGPGVLWMDIDNDLSLIHI